MLISRKEAQEIAVESRKKALDNAKTSLLVLLSTKITKAAEKGEMQLELRSEDAVAGRAGAGVTWVGASGALIAHLLEFLPGGAEKWRQMRYSLPTLLDIVTEVYDELNDADFMTSDLGAEAQCFTVSWGSAGRRHYKLSPEQKTKMHAETVPRNAGREPSDRSPLPWDSITVKGAANYAGVSHARVYAWISMEKFSAEKIWDRDVQSTRWAINFREFKSFMESSERNLPGNRAAESIITENEICGPWIDANAAARILECSTTTVHRYATEHDHFDWMWVATDGRTMSPEDRISDTWPGSGTKRVFRTAEVLEFHRRNLTPVLEKETE